MSAQLTLLTADWSRDECWHRKGLGVRVRTAHWSAATGWSSEPAELSDVLGSSPEAAARTAVFVFGASDLAVVAEPLAELTRALGPARMIGCSTAGEVLNDQLSDDGLVVATCQFDQARVSAAAVPVTDSAGSFEAGRLLAEQLLEQDRELAAIFILSDGIVVNGSDLVAGLAAGAPGVPVSGGLAADGPRFGQTWVLADGQPQAGYLAGLGFSGDSLQLGFGSAGGWDVLGPDRRITRSAGNVLYELDGQPALALYKKYLGERADELPASALLFPLSVRPPEEPDHAVLRTVLAIDEQEQSMTFAGDVPQGSLARLMRATIDRLVDGAEAAARQCGPGAGPDSDTLALAVSCVGRRLVMRRQSEDELTAAVAGLPAGATMLGYYSYGEISPRGATSDLLNQTMTVTTLHEVA